MTEGDRSGEAQALGREKQKVKKREVEERRLSSQYDGKRVNGNENEGDPTNGRGDGEKKK